jgi:hypothetical protein
MIMIPNATATSAAAIAIENNAKTCPSTLCTCLEKATRFKLAAFAIISIENIMRIAFRLTTRPYIPIENSAIEIITKSIS